MVSTLSSRCANALCKEGDAAQAQLSSLAGDYASMLGLDAAQVIAAVDAGQKSAAEEDAVLVRTVHRSIPEKPATPVGKPAESAAILRRGVADIIPAGQRDSTAAYFGQTRSLRCAA